jgi:hypothetical protein
MWRCVAPLLARDFTVIMLNLDPEDREKRLKFNQPASHVGDDGSVAGDRRLVRPGIAAHAHARRVHYGKQHLRLFTVVLL